jgi:hypothetical protein
MLAGEPKVVELATGALASAREIRLAENTAQIKELGDAAEQIADAFVVQASTEVG